MTILTVRHLTRYRYRSPVSFGEHRMMFRPRESYDQRVLESRLSALRWLRYLVRYREIHVENDRASVDIRYDISFQLMTEVGEKWERRQNEKRLELKHEGNRWMFLSGY